MTRMSRLFNNRAEILIAFILIDILLGSCLLLTMSEFIKAKEVKSYNSNAEYNPNTSEYALMDKYDRKGSNFSDFLYSRTAMSVLKKTYQKIKTDKEINYVEAATQNVEYIGTFKLDKRFVSGNDRDSINQKNAGELITPLKSLQSEARFLKTKGIDENALISGRMFDDKNYYSSMTIPVLIGNAYYGTFKVGDRIRANYATNRVQLKVVGVLNKKCNISLAEQELDLDHYIVMPIMTPETKDSVAYKKILMSIKCEGYVSYSSKEQYTDSVAAIKRIANETGYKYVIPIIPITSIKIFGWSDNVCSLIFFMSLMGFIVVSGVVIRDAIYLLKKRFIEKWKRCFCMASLFTVIGLFAIVIDFFAFKAYVSIIEIGISRFIGIIILLAIIGVYLTSKKERWYE